MDIQYREYSMQNEYTFGCILFKNFIYLQSYTLLAENNSTYMSVLYNPVSGLSMALHCIIMHGG